MRTDLKIKEFRESDIVPVSQLLQQLKDFAHSDLEITSTLISRNFSKMNQSPKIYHNLVAVIGDQIVGFLSLVCYATFFHEGGTALINELIVDADWRGRGIGKQFVEEAIQLAKQKGMDQIEVGTELTNDDALNFYSTCGFDEEYRLLGKEFNSRDE